MDIKLHFCEDCNEKFDTLPEPMRMTFIQNLVDFYKGTPKEIIDHYTGLDVDCCLHRALEKHGFLVSTEVSTSKSIYKPKTLDEIEDGTYCCRCYFE